MYIIIYDFGTSSVKTCLFEINSEIRLVAGSSAGYSLHISDDGGSDGKMKRGASLPENPRIFWCWIATY